MLFCALMPHYSTNTQSTYYIAITIFTFETLALIRINPRNTNNTNIVDVNIDKVEK